jgi:hypothetical protein
MPNLNTDLQPLNATPDTNLVDTFFDREPIVTDWNNVKVLIVNDCVTEAEIMAKLKAYEPLREADPREHAHWVDQQILRLVLLHKVGKAIEDDWTCESCGTRRVDPLNADSDYNKICLHCLEQNRQRFDGGSRGSTRFLWPAYNPRSHSWGLLYYLSQSIDSAFIFWLADFYKTRQEAEQALSPITHYFKWLTIRYNGLFNSWLSFEELLPIDEVINLALPLTPEQFRVHLRSRIEIDLGQEHALMSYCIRDAMTEHERKERD